MTVLGSDSSRRDFLSAVPIFAGLSPELRERMAERSRWVEIPAGEYVFRQGESGDSLYVVRSGRLEILIDEPDPVAVRVIARGAVVGELALLTGSARSASVRAKRDSELLVLERDDFAALLQDEPEFALALTRELGRQLQASRGLEPAEAPTPTTIALFPLHGGRMLAEIEGRLTDTLARYGPTPMLDGRDLDPGDYASALDRAERESRQVLLVVRDPGEDDPWTGFCLRQSDRILALYQGGEVAGWLRACEPLQGCDLVLEDPGAQRIQIAPLLEALQPRTTHPLTGGGRFAEGVDRMGRRLAGRALGVVLSGGGARGFVHVGVLAGLLEAGLEIDRVGGCSMGGYIGAMFASEMEPAEMEARCREEFVDRNPLSDYTIPIVSLVRGHKARQMLERTFGVDTKIEELPRDYFCVSCDLLSGDLIVHRTGLLYEAVGASICLPGIAAPQARKKGYLLVDGGVLNNLPVEPMTITAEGPVIAVDVSARFLPPEARVKRRGRPRIRQWAERSRRAVVGSEDALPSLKETLMRSVGIGGVEAVERGRRGADLLIEPDTGVIGLLDFKQLDRMVEIGRQAAREALERAPTFADG